MTLIGERVLLRAYLQSADRAPHTPTYERIVKAARTAGLAGATVFRGIAGFGSRGLIQHRPFSLVEHVPVIVEIVDGGEKLIPFIEGPLDELMIGGMVTLERANVMMYRHRRHETPNEFRLGELLHPLSTMPQIQPKGHMSRKDEGVLLRIFIGEDDRADGKPLYEAIVQKAREVGLAGATVLRGSEGFGAHSVVHKAALLEMSTDLPIVIEMVDVEENVNRLLPYLQSVVKEGMITMEHVLILLYRHGKTDSPASS
jgi:PII-like signaling protein